MEGHARHDSPDLARGSIECLVDWVARELSYFLADLIDWVVLGCLAETEAILKTKRAAVMVYILSLPTTSDRACFGFLPMKLAGEVCSHVTFF